MKRIVILGNGVAGVEAALTIRKHSNDSILLISEEQPVFFARTAMMYVFMNQLGTNEIIPYTPSFFKDHKIQLLQTSITGMDINNSTLYDQKDHPIPYDILLITTGSKPQYPDWAKSVKKGIYSFYHWNDLLDLKASIPQANRPIVIGGGLIASELVEMFSSARKTVRFLVRESHFGHHFLPREESELVHNTFRMKGIPLYLNTSIKKLKHASDSELAFTLLDENGRSFSTDLIGLGTGVIPNIEFLKNTPIKINRGILVDNHLKTNVDNVFAAGDCAELKNKDPKRKAIEANWQIAKSMGFTAAKNIVGQTTSYHQNIWQNTAKFFNLEYHSCGEVPLSIDKNFVTYFYHNPNHSHSLRLAFNKSTGYFTGALSLGLRIDYQKVKKWINEMVTIDFVSKNLPELSYQNKLSFFPEFNLLKESDYE